MISLFRKNLFINSILLLPYIFLIRLKSLFLDKAHVPAEGESYISNQIFGIFDAVIPQGILCMAIIFINALMINRMVIKNNLNKENNLISGLLYALFSSFLLDLLPLSSALLATPLIILSIQCIFNSYNNIKATDEIFLSGFYMSLASLIYFPIIYFFFLTMIGFIIMRSFTFKERVQHVIGWITPFVLSVAWQYFVIYKTMDIPYYFMYKIGFKFLQGVDLKSMLVIIFYIVIILISLFSFGTYMGKKVIAGQKRISILYWLMLFIGFSGLIYSGLSMNHFHLLAFPLCIFITMNFLEMKNIMWPEIIHLLFILLLVSLQLELIKI